MILIGHGGQKLWNKEMSIDYITPLLDWKGLKVERWNESALSLAPMAVELRTWRDLEQRIDDEEWRDNLVVSRILAVLQMSSSSKPPTQTWGMRANIKAPQFSAPKFRMVYRLLAMAISVEDSIHMVIMLV